MNKNFNNPRVLNYLFPFIGGLLYAVGFPMGEFRGIPFAPIIGLVLFFLPLHLPYNGDTDEDKSQLKVELLALLFFSIGYCLLGYYWIPHTLKEFGNIPFPFNNAMGLIFSLIIAPQYLLFILSKRFIVNLNLKSHNFFQGRTNRHLVYAFFLTLLEYYTPQQFPAHLGHTWLTLAPYVGLAPIVGAPFFSFMGFWIVLAIIDGIKNQLWDKFAFGFAIIFLIVNISIPLEYSPSSTANTTRLRLVQANIGNFMKVQSEKGAFSYMQEVYDTYKKLSTKQTDKPIDLIVWAETAYPNLLTSELMKTYPGSAPGIFKEIINEMNSELFIGGYDRNTKAKTRNFQSEYNTTFHFGTDSALKNVYHKIKLIPFGEGLPFGPLNEPLSKIITNVSYFASGENFTQFKTKNDVPFITHICYEILFSWFTRDYLNASKIQPEFLINLTNDSWYGDTSEPYQHLYLAHWRALEFNIPIVRMTNTGVTSVLYPDGSESKRTKIGVEEVLDIDLKTMPREKTIFQQFGFYMTSLLWLIISLISFVYSRKKFS